MLYSDGKKHKGFTASEGNQENAAGTIIRTGFKETDDDDWSCI